MGLYTALAMAGGGTPTALPGGGGILGKLGGYATGGPGLVAAGLLQGLLGARSESRAQKVYGRKLRFASSPERYEQIFGTLFNQAAPSLNQMALDAQMAGSANAQSVRARWARAGLSGVGDEAGTAASMAAALQGRSAREAFRLQLMERAQRQQNLEVDALMRTPYGGISPTSAALSGVGSGLEAFVQARYAESLAGRRNS